MFYDTAPRAGRKILSNAGYLATLTLSNFVLGLLIFPYLSRVLSLESFGTFGFSMSFVVLFQTIVEFGFMISATAEVSKCSQDKLHIGRVISRTMAAKLLLLLASVSIFLVIGNLVPAVKENFLLVFLFLTSGFITALIPDFYFRGVERMRSIALRSLVSKSVSLFLIFSLVKDDSSLILVPIFLALGNLVALGSAIILIRRDGIGFQPVTFASIWQTIVEGLGYFWSRVAASVNQTASSWFLGVNFAPASATMGQFTGATRISSAGELAAIPISDALYPHMLRTRDYSLFKRAYFVGLTVWSIGCSLVFIFSEELCVLLLGSQYSGTGTLLRILVVGTFFAYSSNMFGYVALAPLGKAHLANYSLLFTASFTLIVLGLLSAGGEINAVNVCVTVTAGHIINFLFRFTSFMRFRGIAKSNTPELGE